MIRRLRVKAAAALVGLAALLLASCTSTATLPKEIRVPIPVPCEIEQVPATELPAPDGDESLYGLAKIALAQIGLLKAENERLRAANNSPCREAE